MTDQEQPSTTPRPRKRRRLAISCEQCRRRKVQCDRNIPCGPCARARNSLRCSYSGTSVRRDPGESHSLCLGALGTTSSVVPPGVVGTPQSQGSQVQDERSGDGRNRYQDRDQDQAESSLQALSVRTIQDIQQRLQRLEELLAGRGREISLVEATQQPSGSTVVRLSLPATADTVPATLPRLRVTPDKTKLFGQTHWLHVVDKSEFIGELDVKETKNSLDNAKAELTDTIKDCRNLRLAVKTQQSVRLNHPVPDLVSTIPCKAICDELVNGYLRTFELIYRIIHIPTFWKEYNQFWEQPQSASMRFLMKLVLILAIGTTFYQDRAGFERIRRLAQTWIYAAQWWLTGPSEKSTNNLDGLQVVCLLLLARQTNSLGGQTWLSADYLLRMAMAMGLHCDFKIFPAFIVPSNIDDKGIDPDTKTPPNPKPNSGYTETSIQILLLKLLPLRAEVARLMNGFRQRQSYETVLKLGSGLRTACRDIAAFFHSNSSSHTSSSRELGPTDFHRKFLDMYLHRYIVHLHRPFMVQARDGPQYYLSRKTCLESSMVIASYANSLNLPSDDALDDLSRLAVFGAGSFRGPLSLDVITVLGLEIITQFEEEASTRASNSSQVIVNDSLDEIAKANRVPLIRSLEHILDQLLQIIALGIPSLKRYNFLSAMLSQIRAMESSRCVRQAVYETVKESVKKCYSLLQASYAIGTPQDSVESLTSPAAAGVSSGFNFGLWDCDIGLDIPSLLYSPGFVEDGNLRW